MINNKTIIAITHGDINGISYEIILKTFAEPRVYDDFVPVIYGSSKAAGYYRKQLDLQAVNLNVVNSIEEIHLKKVNLINCTDEELKVEMGNPTEEAGRAALSALERATEDMMNGSVDAIVTAPINKKTIQGSEFNFPGHTEYLEAKFSNGTPALMLMINDVMRVAVVTGHIPVNEIASKLSTELILEKLRVLNHCLKEDFTIIRPRIAVLGLNPHAGEEGLLGNEEKTIIQPALDAAEKEGILCMGPYPADGFFGSGYFNKFDGVLAMYHDQGLIPFKAISMESGVNYTAGLPIVRTSPAHGTAYQITGQNIASEESFRQALFMAYDVFHNRTRNQQIAANPLKVEVKKERGGGSRIA